jgi:hypothetical protein
MWARLFAEPKFDDFLIAGRHHNPPYVTFAVVTFIPRKAMEGKLIRD